MMNKLKAVPPLDTQISPGNRMFSAGDHPNDLSVFYLKVQIAPASAKTASCQDSVHSNLS